MSNDPTLIVEFAKQLQYKFISNIFHVSIFLKEEFHHVNCRNCTLERMKNNNNVFGVKMLQFFAQLQSNSLSTTFQLFVQAYKNTIYSLYTNHIVSLTRDFRTRVCMSTTTSFSTLQNFCSNLYE